MDFLAGQKNWANVCRLDSDGDGRTNGEELGDPTCTWVEGMENPDGFISHPGVCEPITNPGCATNNKFLLDLPECESILSGSSPILKETAPVWCPNLPQPLYSMQLVMDPIEVPPEEVIYYCKQFEMPADVAYHVMAFEPIVPEQDLDIVDSIYLYACVDIAEIEALNSIGGYPRTSECGMITECQNLIAIWLNGDSNRCFNEAAGLPMGRNNYWQVILQVLYKNGAMETGRISSSGLKLYYSSALRQNEQAVLVVGQEAIAIPPVTSNFPVTARTFMSSKCSLQRLTGGLNYNISSVLFHVRGMGTNVKLTIIKQQTGRRISIVDRDIEESKAVFEALVGNEQAQFEPGDNIEIECQYDSSMKTRWTYFGANPYQDEYCYAIMDIYPKPMNQLSQSLNTLGTVCNQANFYL